MKAFLIQTGSDSADALRLLMLALLVVVAASALFYSFGCFVDLVQRWALATGGLAACVNN